MRRKKCGTKSSLNSCFPASIVSFVGGVIQSNSNKKEIVEIPSPLTATTTTTAATTTTATTRTATPAASFFFFLPKETS